MHRKDNEFLERVKKELDEGRLKLKADVDRRDFDRIMKRLIHEPPTPKTKKKDKDGKQPGRRNSVLNPTDAQV
jgi:hypothetical protein